MARTRKVEEFDESPLVSRPTLHSTINPDRLEHNRFTEIRDLENEGNSSPVRIIIYAIVVILVGVGTAFLARNLFLNNNQQPTETEQENTATDDEDSNDQITALNINPTIQSDSSATNVASNSVYSDAAQATLGSTSQSMDNVSLAQISYAKYTTFSRVIMNFEGNTSLPKVNVTFDADDNVLTISVPNLTDIAAQLKSQVNLNDVVESIAYSAENNTFQISLSEDSKYRVADASGDLLIDFKTVAELNKPESSTTANGTNNTSTNNGSTTTNTSSNGTKPAAPFYTNAFSRDTQYISSSVNTNSIAYNNYWIADYNTYFEFSLGQAETNSESAIPNVKAYMQDEAGKSYIYFEIENLSNAPFVISRGKTMEQILSETGAVINPDSVNFVRIELLTFENGKATYKIELKNKADYKLVSQVNFDEVTRVTTIQIED
jgi:hypothetical protein